MDTAPPQMERASSARVRAATTLRTLKRRARELAENDAPSLTGNCRQKAVRSAFVSRQTGRHYARLLAEHVAALESERDEVMQNNQVVTAQIETMRAWLNANTPPDLCFIDDVIEGRDTEQLDAPNG